MTRRDIIDRAMQLCDGTGVEPHALHASASSHTLGLATCADYRAVCAAAKAKVDGGRLLNHPTRHVYDALAGDLVIEHLCWPHLPCWGES